MTEALGDRMTDEVLEISVAPLAPGDVLIHKLLGGRYGLYGVEDDGSGDRLFYRFADSLYEAEKISVGMLPSSRRRWYSDWASPDAPQPYAHDN